ncbi:MAG: hypothetical protein WED34_12665 [Planctomycetales bacterium]
MATSVAVADDADEQPKRLNLPLISMWSGVALFAIGAVLFVAWHVNDAPHQARMRGERTPVAATILRLSGRRADFGATVEGMVDRLEIDVAEV